MGRQRRTVPSRTSLSLILASALLAAAPAAAAPSPQDMQKQEAQKQEELKRVERDLQAGRQRQEAIERDAASLTKEINGLRDQLVIAGRSAQENEAALNALEEAMGGLQSDALSKRRALAGRRQELGQLLGALERMSMQPPEAMLALPQPPRDTVRGAMLMGAALPVIDDRVADLRTELDDLRAVEDKIRRQKELVAASSGKLMGERQSLDQLLKRKQALEKRTAEEGARTASRNLRLASSARDLKELLDRLEVERKAEEDRRAEESRREAERRADAQRRGEPAPPMPIEVAVGPRGSRTVPASGRVAYSWNQTTDTGASARGLTIQTRTDAVVVAPAGGTVLFAGPFRGYGLILIIDHGDGYHSLLAGLGRIDADAGRSVAAGEPVGSMGKSDERSPSLYFELRHNGQPTNPQPWLAARRAN